MTLDELAQTLPNGFHDSRLAGLQIDYVLRQVTFDVEVWVGDLEAADRDLREVYRPAVLTISGLEFCAIEPPDLNAPGLAKRLTIDTGSRESLPPQVAAKLPATVSAGAFTNWIFVSQWNAFIHIAATEARLEWMRDAAADPSA